MIDDNDVAVGFGPYYKRQDRCHLGRPIIAPAYRGRKPGETLIDLLVREGGRTISVNGDSLFELGDNAPARRLYAQIGFRNAVYPGNDIDLSKAIYKARETGHALR